MYSTFHIEILFFAFLPFDFYLRKNISMYKLQQSISKYVYKMNKILNVRIKKRKSVSINASITMQTYILIVKQNWHIYIFKYVFISVENLLPLRQKNYMIHYIYLNYSNSPFMRTGIPLDNPDKPFPFLGSPFVAHEPPVFSPPVLRK